MDWSKTSFVPVAHHLAHASSAYHLSGFAGKTAILGVDGKGEYATTFFGVGEGGRISRIREFYDPDSLAGVYGAVTEYLGFEMLDGEYKVMGMAPYGDPTRFDFEWLVRVAGQRSGRPTASGYAVGQYGWPATFQGGRARPLLWSRVG